MSRKRKHRGAPPKPGVPPAPPVTPPPATTSVNLLPPDERPRDAARKPPSLWRYVLLTALLGFFGGAAVRFLKRHPPAKGADIVLAPVKGEFYHDQFLEWTLTSKSGPASAQMKKRTMWTWVEKDGLPVETIGRITKVPFKYDDKAKAWRASWPCPWNAATGTYELNFDTAGLKLNGLTIEKKKVKIAGRAFDPMPGGFGVLTLESIASMRNFLAPDGTRKDWHALLETAQFMGADAIVVQGAETGGYDRKLPEDFPWITQSQKTLQELGAACHQAGLKFGVYAMCFMIGGPPERSPDYKYGWIYENGRMKNGLEMRKRRGASITDPKRLRDIVNLLERWKKLPELDFIGVDYIRPVFGGYELVDDFVKDMPVETPADWKQRSFQQRMEWIFTNRKAGHDFIDKWYWYRAHRSAQIVRGIKAAIGSQKPLWAFNLSWEKGWHHGQDPVMMRDAGIDLDAIMCYEADSAQFRGFVKQWHQYVRQSQVNVLVGDTLDWPLHQKTLNPAGPEDFFNRDMLAITQFHADAPVRGVFVHDYIRGVRGRLGPYSSHEWLLAGGAVMTRLRQLHGKLAYDLSLKFADSAAPGAAQTATVSVGPRLPGVPVKVELFGSSDVDISPRAFELSAKSTTTAVTVRWSPNGASAARANRAFLAVRAVRDSAPSERAQIHIMYFQGQRGRRPAPGPTEDKRTPQPDSQNEAPEPELDRAPEPNP